jgi:hypothetical protein
LLKHSAHSIKVWAGAFGLWKALMFDRSREQSEISRRRGVLVSGVGLACAYAGGVDY